MRARMITLITLALLVSCGKHEEPPSSPAKNRPQTESSAAPQTRSQPQQSEDPQQPAPTQLDEAVVLNNRAVGLMGRFEYVPAVDAFQKVVEMRPDWLDAKVNLAIATLNRQHEADVDEALRLLSEVLEADPDNARANYCTGLLKAYIGPPNDPLPYFMAAAKAAPNDAVAAYYVGQSLANQRDHAGALKWYQRAIHADPYLRSAYYAANRSLRMLRRNDEANDMLAIFQRLDGNPRAHTVEFKYKKMGALGEAVAVGESPQPEPPLQARAEPYQPAIEFDSAMRVQSPDRRITITAAPPLTGNAVSRFITGAGLDTPNSNLGVTPMDPLLEVTDVNAPLWGDIDNDGLFDVYLCRRGPNQLWRQASPGIWEDITLSAGVANGDADTVDGALVDADHDGDLDIFCVNADAPDDLLSNNLDGTFRSIGADQGLTGADRPSRQVLFADLDADRDADILVLHDAPPHEIYLNDRMWAYSRPTNVDSFVNADLAAVVHADLGADGITDLIALDRQGDLRRWTWNEGLAGGDVVVESAAPAADAPSSTLAVFDATGDGAIDLLLATPRGWTLYAPLDDWRVIQRADTPNVTPIWTAPLGADAPTLIGYDRTDDGNLRLVANQPADTGATFAALDLTGALDPGQSMRTNTSGIGTRVAARVGNRWTVQDTFRNTSGPGQSLQPLTFGLAGRDTIDFIDIDWPDGVFQSEIDIPAAKLTTVAETQRQLSSCPVLFAWDGTHYRFVTDCLGVGGIGYAVGPNEYAPPRPWENILLPPDLAQRTDAGNYNLLLTEPMEEACYLDSASLVAYDLPPGWQLFLDERMGINDPQPTGEPRFFRNEVRPARVTNDRDQDVSHLLARADGAPADPGHVDVRFIGRLEAEHVLTLDFDHPIDDLPGDPTLIADGWIEYPYSQTSFAAWQARADYRAPTIEARDAQGAWHTLHDQIGYPAGMPRRCAFPLGALPPGCTALRVRTNMEIYWDRLAIACAEPCPDARRVEGSLVASRLSYAGFPRRDDLPYKLPNYDYDDRAPFWDTRHQTGLYTAYGSCTDVVRDHDDAVAIFGPGEQIAFEFDLPEPMTDAGWTRRLILQTRGWCKDMDLFTRTGETIDPMPSSGRPTEARDRLHDQYNTRFQSGR